MREIKFIAYCPQLKSISKPFSFGHILNFSDVVYKSLDVEKHIVMQFTGLKDKNGVDIYEGKNSVKLIIKGCGEGLADIVMHEGKWCVYEPSQGFAPLFDLLNGNSTEIYSNPELLNNNQNN